MWYILIKLKEQMNKQENKAKHPQTQTTIVWSLPEGRGRQVVKGKGNQIYGNRGFDFGWWVHSAIYK